VAATADYAEEEFEWIPAGPAFETYNFIADTMEADKYSRETFVNHVTEQSTYGVLDFDRRGKGRGRGVHMYFTLSENPETIIETIRQDSRFTDLNQEDAPISAVVREQLKKFRSKN
jgi:cell division control protein 6